MEYWRGIGYRPKNSPKISNSSLIGPNSSEYLAKLDEIDYKLRCNDYIDSQSAKNTFYINDNEDEGQIQIPPFSPIRTQKKEALGSEFGRVSQILSRLRYLHSKNGLSLYELIKSVQNDANGRGGSEESLNYELLDNIPSFQLNSNDSSPLSKGENFKSERPSSAPSSFIYSPRGNLARRNLVTAMPALQEEDEESDEYDWGGEEIVENFTSHNNEEEGESNCDNFENFDNFDSPDISPRSLYRASFPPPAPPQSAQVSRPGTFRPNTAETFSFLANPPEFSPSNNGRENKEMIRYYQRALEVARGERQKN